MIKNAADNRIDSVQDYPTRTRTEDSLFGRIQQSGTEQIMFCSDVESGLRSIIVIHDTTLGPSLGGVRMWPYATETAALDDGLRLAQMMTLKAAAAGLDLGGSTNIVIGDPAHDKTEALLRAQGRFIATLGRRFIPVNDVGTTQADIEIIGREATPVCDNGDPSPYTALGTLEAIRACLRVSTGSSSLRDVTVAVQGAGNVGSALTELLTAESANVLVADIDPSRSEQLAQRFGATVIAPEQLVSTQCDVLAPCALGAVVTDESLPRLNCCIIAGGANNVLADEKHAAQLDTRGILYAPDFLANAGGLIYLEEQLLGHDEKRTEQRVRSVAQLVTAVIERARTEGITTVRAATDIAENRLATRRHVRPAFIR
ncbi:Leu/Phe/Val dehydrogenase [Nocardia sp. NPDC050630]|uniref:Leu/Phe/Val dehydrogenase n=1 Tax=Nocardia sp. NPDC050630 TaxID=3364321 RepID=UPI00378BBA5E